MTKKEKELEKSKKIINIIKWSLVGVGWSALCFCFIGLLVLGIRGCSDKQKRAAETNVTTPVKRKTISRSTSDLYVNSGDYYYTSQFNVNCEDYGGYDDLSFSSDYNVSGFINDSPIDSFSIGFDVNSVQDDRYRLYWDVSYNNTLVKSLYIEDSQIDENNWDIGDKLTISYGFEGDQVLYELLQSFALYDSFDFSFNDIINPYAPIGLARDYFQQGVYSGQYSVLSGLFKTTADGTQYKEILIGYISATADRYGTADDYHTNNINNTYRYMYLAYRRVSDNTIVIVNNLRYVRALSGNDVGQVVVTNENYWVSNIFKSIRVYYLNNSTTLPASNYSARELLTAFNNNSVFDGLTPSITN